MKKHVYSIHARVEGVLQRRNKVHNLVHYEMHQDSIASRSYGWIFYAPSVLVMRMRRYYALQLILGQGFSATMLLLFEEVDRQNAGPSKVLMTERLIFFCDYYEIESGQDNVGLHITVLLLLSSGS